MITVVDYKLNNLRSIENTLRRLGHGVEITSAPEGIAAAERLILPGVGAFRDGMRSLRHLGLVEPIINKVRGGIPTLGICLGMHLLFEDSDEFGLHEGLGLLDGHVRRLPEGSRIPHMGWNQLHFDAPDPLLDGLQPGCFVYFVHSYYPEPGQAVTTLARTDYGRDFASVVRKGTIWATQFHPEKSQQVGERILDNFGRLT